MGYGTIMNERTPRLCYPMMIIASRFTRRRCWQFIPSSIFLSPLLLLTLLQFIIVHGYFSFDFHLLITYSSFSTFLVFHSIRHFLSFPLLLSLISFLIDIETIDPQRGLATKHVDLPATMDLHRLSIHYSNFGLLPLSLTKHRPHHIKFPRPMDTIGPRTYDP
jgi:hypothetical protein